MTANKPACSRLAYTQIVLRNSGCTSNHEDNQKNEHKIRIEPSPTLGDQPIECLPSLNLRYRVISRNVPQCFCLFTDATLYLKNSSSLRSIKLFYILQKPEKYTYSIEKVCSGMWQKFAKSRDPYIEIIFGPASSGQLALLKNAWQEDRVYVCTLDAISQSLCTKAELGEFIISPLPTEIKRESLNIWTQRIKLESQPTTTNSGTQMGSGPYRYNVTKTGYYCVGAVPLTVGLPSTSNSTYSTYTGVVSFENVFKGNLPAGEYPKVAFYGFVAIIYVFVGLLWGYNCYQHRTEILPVQHYISGSIMFLVVELTTVFGYYKYLNDFGNPSMTRALLVLVSILSAARNALSFFMLLIVSLGYSIVKDSLGSVMLRVRLLAISHFIFGVVYAIGMAVFPFETAGLWIFFMVFPLAFSLTGFMMWIMAALAHTIQDLESRKQTFKTQMFVRLHRILIGAAIVIVIFFFVSSVSFSNRLEQISHPGHGGHDGSY
ncbi:hypothetical protein Pst134EA_031987 [Puccinia striiformis f. sp. tritici]|uniref:uncharacterized protein n=1 Tax=Puccinia striiformis f. sp. tritici TaxID=168172 RepID=UPI002007429D|nr:uncharacterized protein Pst134EA_031987 [Puccinia striiformis f. sp. tritici]KAH9441943.1 hypothetical protein Pst134EA_031987 [Puccinia striiformis f. sp. tritici]